MKKKLFLLILVLVLMIPVVTSAQEQPIKLVVHGNNVETDVAPFIENGRTLVPVRVISETLGFKVQWIAEEEKVVIGSPTDAGSGNGIALFIGNATAYLNEHETVILDVAPKVISGRTFVPVRFVAEQFGLNVRWDEENWTVIIGEETPAPVVEAAPLPVATNTNIQSIVGSGGTNVTESEPIEGQYIGNKNTGVFHYPGCSSVKKMSAKNKVSISSRDNAINGGYRPCQICKP